MQKLTPRARYFTPSEANLELQKLRPRITRAADQLRSCKELFRQLRNNEPMSESQRVHTAQEASRLKEEVRMFVEEMGELGIEVKGLDPPLLDFPALHLGREVLLCWRDGERAVTSWHSLDGGFAGRAPVTDGDTGAWEWLN